VGGQRLHRDWPNARLLRDLLSARSGKRGSSSVIVLDVLRTMQREGAVAASSPTYV